MSSVIARLYKNLFRSPAPQSKIDKSNDILPYGQYNDFPIRITEAIYASPTATAAINKLQKYIGGDGIADADIAKMIVNSDGDTMDTLLKKISEDFAMLRGFSLKVSYNQLFKITEVRHLPFENGRLTIPDKEGNIHRIGYNAFYGIGDYKKKDTVYYHVFDPSKASEQFAIEKDDFQGQVKWYAQTKINNRFYPVPDYYAAMPDIQADAQVSTYRERLVNNNFYQSTLIQLIGDPNEKIPLNEDGTEYTTVGDQLDEDLRKMTGGSAAGSSMVLWSKTKEGAANIVPFPNNYTDKISEAFIAQTQQNICMGVGVHPVLIGIDQGGALGQNNLLLNAIKMLQQNVNDAQREIERELQDVFKNWHQTIAVEKISIRPLSLTVDLPDYVLNALSAEEKRIWIAKNYDVEMVEQVAKDATQQRLNTLSTLSPLLANKVIESLTEDEVRGLVGLDPVPEDEKQVVETQLNLFEGFNEGSPMNLSKGAIEARYNEYYSFVNMTYKELQTWSESECCKQLGHSKQPIQRNLSILNLNKGDWSTKEYRMAGITIQAIKRLSEMEPLSEVKNSGGGSCGFKRDLALKNYGHNVNKK